MSAWIAAGSAVVAAALSGGLVSSILTHRRDSQRNLSDSLLKRLEDVEVEVRALRAERYLMDARFTQLWAYARSLIDYSVKYRREDSPPVPSIPSDLLD